MWETASKHNVIPSGAGTLWVLGEPEPRKLSFEATSGRRLRDSLYTLPSGRVRQRTATSGARMDYAWVGLGGCVGACARYALGNAVGRRFGIAFPYGTFVVNLTGAFLIGVILTLLTERYVADPRWRLLLVVGVLGGYTTFSSFAYEAFALADRGEWLRAAVYVVGSNVLGIAACVAGILLTRRFAGG